MCILARALGGGRIYGLVKFTHPSTRAQTPQRAPLTHPIPRAPFTTAGNCGPADSAADPGGRSHSAHPQVTPQHTPQHTPQRGPAVMAVDGAAGGAECAAGGAAKPSAAAAAVVVPKEDVIAAAQVSFIFLHKLLYNWLGYRTLRRLICEHWGRQEVGKGGRQEVRVISTRGVRGKPKNRFDLGRSRLLKLRMECDTRTIIASTWHTWHHLGDCFPAWMQELPPA